MNSYFSKLLDWFPNAEGISLPLCQIRSIKGIHKCRKLTVLDLTDNLLTEISPDLEHLKDTLEGLSVSGSPITHVPSFLTKMTRLKHLYVANTLLTELPDDIGSLHELVTLNMKHSLIARLPDSFVKLTVGVQSVLFLLLSSFVCVKS